MNKHLIAAVLALATASASAQYIKYPAEVREVFENADKAVSPSGVNAPVIAVTEAERCEEVLAAGGSPVIVSTGICDVAALRSICSGIDGFVLSESFARQLEDEVGGEGDKPCMLLLKSVLDRNIPIHGSTPLLESVNRGLMRISEHYGSCGEFVAKAATFRRARLFMASHLCIDTHCDLPERYDEGFSVGLRTTSQMSMQKMNESGMDAQVLIAFISKGAMDREGLRKAGERCLGEIMKIRADIDRYGDYCGLATTPAEIRALREQGRKAMLIGVENAYGLGGDIANVRRYRDLGATYITLSWMYDNDVCHSSSHSADTTLGLTPFGRKVVAEMNRLGVIIDLSHTSEGTFWDVYRLSKAPFICSHSGASAVWKHDRNITDRQLRAIAEKDGVIQVYIVPDYMAGRENWDKVGIDQSIDHLMHCIKVAGIDHVGIGADFDGGGGGWGMNGTNDLVNVTVKLLERGLNEADLAKIWGGNYLRVMDKVQSLARD